MKYVKQLFFVCASALAVTINATAQTPAGKLVLAKGQQLLVESTVKTTVSMDMMGQAIEMVADANMTRSIDVKDKKGTSFLISSTLTKMKSNVNAMGQEQNFDSEKNEGTETETGKMLKGILNVPQEVELNSEAKVLTAKAKDSSVTNAGIMDIMNGADAAGAADAFLIIPEGKNPGDIWSDSSVMDGVKIYRTYTLKAVNGNKASVIVDGNQITSKTVEQMGMEVTITSDLKISGETTVDIDTGVIEQKTLNMDGKGTAEMMGQSIPMTTKLVSATTVKVK